MTTGCRLLAACFGCTFALLFDSGQPTGAEGDGEAYVPAKQAIVALVGSDFYDKYITPQMARAYSPSANCLEQPSSCASYLRHPYSFVTFTLKMPEYPFVDETISCVVDSNGEVSQLSGTPDCVHKPLECTFPYNETAGREIATRAGLESGVTAWRVSFHWHRDFGYVWEVRNTLHGRNREPSGRTVLIDANDGRILGFYGWFTVH